MSVEDKERKKAERLLRQATQKKHAALDSGDRFEAERWAKATAVIAESMGNGPLDGTQS